MRKLTIFLMFFLFSVSQVWAQNRTVTGKVTDEKGANVAGASVTVSGSTKGAITKSDGTFTLTVPANAKSIRISSIGLEPQSVIIPSSGVITVKMAPSKGDDLDGVTVKVNTGISVVDKKVFTGASSNLGAKDAGEKPVGSIDQLFQGKVPGLLSLTGSGAPGTSANIIIRGTGSISGGTDPLYIVDGIPVEAGVFQGINANDIASLDVMRDAAGTALYGSRGSAGVVVVTTKRGTGGKTKFRYNFQFGYKNKPENTYQMMNSKQLLKAQEDYGKFFINSGLDPAFAGDPNNTPGWYYSKLNPNVYGAGTPADQALLNAAYDSISKINTNWSDYFLRTGKFSNHEISMQGGAGKTRIYSNLGYYSEEGTTMRTDMKRVSWRNNIDYSDDKFTISVNSSLAYTKRNFQQSTQTNSLGNPFLVSNISAPYAKVYNADGSFATGNGTRFAAANTLDLTNVDLNYNDQIKVLLSVNASYKITKNVTANLVAGIDFRETQGTNYGSKLAFTRRTSTSITGQAGFYTETLTRYFQPTIRPSVNWRKMFGTKHDVDVTVLGEYLREFNKSLSMRGFGIDPKLPNTPAAITQGNGTNQLFANVSGGKTQNTLVSGLIMARYTYDEKYTITGSYRNDGASKLPVDTRWQKFFSVGGVWDVMKEKFMEKNKVLGTLRIKASYGSAGNFNNFPFSDFYYIPTYGVGQYNGLPTTAPTSPGNPLLRWENIYTTNIGVDFSLLKDRLYGDFNIYKRLTKNLFVDLPLSPAVAAVFGSAINANGGSLQNKGFEWNVNYELIRSKNATLTLFTTGSYNQNKVLDLGGAPSYEQGTELITVGMPLGSHFDVKWGGVDAATGAPLYYDLAGKLTNVYSAANKVQEFGTWESPWKGGWGARLKYKSFDFNVLFSFQKGAYKSNNLEYFVENPVGFMSNGYNQAVSLNFWQKPGDIASTPSPQYGTNFSSKLIHDASFIRLKEVSAYYTLPQSSISKLKFVKSFKFFVMGNNLYIWTKWIGSDPEAGATNINLGEFPNPKAATIGLEVGF